ncbi:MAG: FAD-dependent oxidoreductase [Balneolaceae bacterium]|nr:FAD-dependent oxidoreductase [Balneolaceae bacterium]
MIDSNLYDVVILGAGIAGLSATDEFLNRGLSCLVIDSKLFGNGATSAPMLLANPATGRRAKKTWQAEESFALISDFLERVQSGSKTPFFENNGVLRPALTEDISKDFERSPQKYEWPDNWLTWLPRSEFSKEYPFFGDHYGGLIVENSLSINGPEFIKASLEYLSAKGAEFLECTQQYSYSQKSNQWIFELNHQKTVSSKMVVDATGFGQTQSERWNFLPLHAVKGQTATFRFEDELPLNHSVSSLGYMAFMSHYPTQLTVGSTYEHSFDHLKPTEDGLNRLKGKLRQTFPDFVEKIVNTEQWANVRVTVPDKLPIVGHHPEYANLYIIGALGSKGMMMGRYAAYCLAESIINQKIIDPTISVERYF